MLFYTFLPKLLNMSLTASVAIVFVLLLRLLLKKAPKIISYALWSIVLFRLLCPISIESGLSLFGLMNTPVTTNGTLTSSIEYIPSDIVHMEYPSLVLPAPGIGEAIRDTLPQGEEQLVADPLEAPIAIATYIWMAGVLGMGIYALVSYLRLRWKLLTASRVRENIYLADEITSPFVMGLFRPKIYLPSAMDEREQSYIIFHEQYHIRRLDHIAKALAFVALSIHWFNPLVWIAFMMAGKDMEMSCDEAVVKKMGDGVLADYTASLLSLATGKQIIAGTPLAFGEGDPKGRIRNLANWRKPAIGGVLAAVAVCTVLAVCLLTNPKPFPLELDSLQISWAKAMRSDEPASFELNTAELEELKSRLLGLNIGREDNDLEGFTPYYSISIQTSGPNFSVVGFDLAGEHVALQYQGDYYRINDSEFSAYLLRLCMGGAKDTAELLEATTEDAGQATILSGDYDFDHDGAQETVKLVTYSEESTWYEVLVTRSDGTLLWKSEAYPQHSGYNSIFACHLEDGDYLLQYHPTMYQGSCTYTYELFSLDLQGNPITAQEGDVSFDINWGSPLHGSFDAEAVADFMDELNDLLAQSKLLLTTDTALEGIDPDHPQDYLWWLQDGEFCEGYVYDSSMSLRENLMEFSRFIQEQ